jgi:hypothetical protein
MGNIVAQHLKVLVTKKMLDIASRAGKEIIDTKDLASLL